MSGSDGDYSLEEEGGGFSPPTEVGDDAGTNTANTNDEQATTVSQPKSISSNGQLVSNNTNDSTTVHNINTMLQPSSLALVLQFLTLREVLTVRLVCKTWVEGPIELDPTWCAKAFETCGLQKRNATMIQVWNETQSQQDETKQQSSTPTPGNNKEISKQHDEDSGSQKAGEGSTDAKHPQSNNCGTGSRVDGGRPLRIDETNLFPIRGEDEDELQYRKRRLDEAGADGTLSSCCQSHFDKMLKCFHVLKYLPEEVVVRFNRTYGRHVMPLHPITGNIIHYGDDRHHCGRQRRDCVDGINENDESTSKMPSLGGTSIPRKKKKRIADFKTADTLVINEQNMTESTTTNHDPNNIHKSTTLMECNIPRKQGTKRPRSEGGDEAISNETKGILDLVDKMGKKEEQVGATKEESTSALDRNDTDEMKAKHSQGATSTASEGSFNGMSYQNKQQNTTTNEEEEDCCGSIPPIFTSDELETLRRERGVWPSSSSLFPHHSSFSSYFPTLSLAEIVYELSDVYDDKLKPLDMSSYYYKCCIPNLPSNLTCPHCRSSCDKRRGGTTLMLATISYKSQLRFRPRQGIALTYTPRVDKKTAAEGDDHFSVQSSSSSSSGENSGAHDSQEEEEDEQLDDFLAEEEDDDDMVNEDDMDDMDGDDVDYDDDDVEEDFVDEDEMFIQDENDGFEQVEDDDVGQNKNKRLDDGIVGIAESDDDDDDEEQIIAKKAQTTKRKRRMIGMGNDSDEDDDDDNDDNKNDHKRNSPNKKDVSDKKRRMIGMDNDIDDDDDDNDDDNKNNHKTNSSANKKDVDDITDKTKSKKVIVDEDNDDDDDDQEQTKEFFTEEPPSTPQTTQPHTSATETNIKNQEEDEFDDEPPLDEQQQQHYGFSSEDDEEEKPIPSMASMEDHGFSSEEEDVEQPTRKKSSVLKKESQVSDTIPPKKEDGTSSNNVKVEPSSFDNETLDVVAKEAASNCHEGKDTDLKTTDNPKDVAVQAEAYNKATVMETKAEAMSSDADGNRTPIVVKKIEGETTQTRSSARSSQESDKKEKEEHANKLDPESEFSNNNMKVEADASKFVVMSPPTTTSETKNVEVEVDATTTANVISKTNSLATSASVVAVKEEHVDPHPDVAETDKASSQQNPTNEKDNANEETLSDDVKKEFNGEDDDDLGLTTLPSCQKDVVDVTTKTTTSTNNNNDTAATTDPAPNAAIATDPAAAIEQKPAEKNGALKREEPCVATKKPKLDTTTTTTTTTTEKCLDNENESSKKSSLLVDKKGPQDVVEEDKLKGDKKVFGQGISNEEEEKDKNACSNVSETTTATPSEEKKYAKKCHFPNVKEYCVQSQEHTIRQYERDTSTKHAIVLCCVGCYEFGIAIPAKVCLDSDDILNGGCWFHEGRHEDYVKDDDASLFVESKRPRRQNNNDQQNEKVINGTTFTTKVCAREDCDNPVHECRTCHLSRHTIHCQEPRECYECMFGVYSRQRRRGTMKCPCLRQEEEEQDCDDDDDSYDQQRKIMTNHYSSGTFGRGERSKKSNDYTTTNHKLAPSHASGFSSSDNDDNDDDSRSDRFEPHLDQRGQNYHGGAAVDDEAEEEEAPWEDDEEEARWDDQEEEAQWDEDDY